MGQPKSENAVVIAGGSGFVGTSLALHLLSAGRRVIVLSRKASVAKGAEHVPWDARMLGEWRAALDSAVGLVNLVGRSVDCVKTPDHQDEILRSRVEATRVLGEAMRSIASPPPVWVQMSTGSIYGDPPAIVCSEDSPFGMGFAPTVGRAWEEAFHNSVLPSQRKVILRTSFVIGRDRGAGGGALGKLRKVVRLGLGGKVASGSQGMSWIHELDMNRLIERGLNDDRMDGPYIATAPNPVSQQEFMRELRRLENAHRPAGVGMDGAIRAKYLLNTDAESLYGRYLVSNRLKDENFEFRFPILRAALADLFQITEMKRS